MSADPILSPPPAAGTRRAGLRGIVLTLSLAVNLLVAGLAVGAWLRPDMPPPPGGGRPEAERRLGFGQWAAGLERADFRAMREAFAAEGLDFRALRQAEMADRRALVALLRATPFDAAAFAEVTDRIHQRGVERADIGHRLTRDYVSALPDARRAAFADRLEQAIRRSEAPRPRERTSHD